MPGPAKRVLVTGSRGFTGCHLLQALSSEGYEVIGLINEGQPTSNERLADLTDALKLDAVVADLAPDYVVHLAAISFVGTDDVQSIYATNTIGTLNLLDALSKLSRMPERVILASSANVYGDAGDLPIEETVLPAPINHYGASKLAMEALANVYREQVPCVITRPFNYTGPGQASHFLVPKIVRHFAERADRIELGNLDVERDYLDVRSVVAIYSQLLRSPQADGATLNICSGRSIALREIIERLERITGHNLEIVVNPEYVRSNEIRRMTGSNARLREVVDDWPDYEFDDTLRDMLEAAE